MGLGLGQTTADEALTPRAGSYEYEAVRVHQATKEYGAFRAVDHVDLDIHDGELFTLLGPSGSGKTTLLRMIAGLTDITSGEILINEKDVRSSAPYERDIAMVFQSLALFPHLDVAGNIEFPLKMRRWSRPAITKAVAEVLDVIRLPGVQNRKVSELSGGQRQRVALARALVYRPRLLLLDEPLGSLDRKLREELQLELLRLHHELDVTIINVTHDQREALMLSDRIGVMRDGCLEQVSRPQELYRDPASAFVAQFIGDANVFSGTVSANGEGVHLQLEDSVVLELSESSRHLTGRRAHLAVRAEHIQLSPDRADCDGFAGKVRLAAFEGERFYYEVDCPQLGTVKVSVSADRCGDTVSPRDAVRCSWKSSNAIVLEA